MLLATISLNLTEAIIADSIGLLVLFIAIFGSSYRLKSKSRESRIVFILIAMMTGCCLLEPIAFVVDGATGIIKEMNKFYIFLNIFTNSINFLCNIFAACLWNAYVVIHLTGHIKKRREYFLSIICGLFTIAVFINAFVPFLFSVDENGVYHRGTWGYYIYSLLVIFIFIVDTVVAFIRIRFKGGMLKFFPILLFVIPAIVGIVTQLLVYGISTIYVSLALGICGILMAMQNDMIFRDNLTGLYNRFYLDVLKQKMMKSKRKQEYTAMMLDLNGFKMINDTYGHLTGDEALIHTANLLRFAVGSYGNVIRYAGDEFIIILNTNIDAIIQERIQKIDKAFDEFNASGQTEYKLYISIGYSKADFKNQTVDELMNDIDQKMFLEKKKFHLEHPEWDRA